MESTKEYNRRIAEAARTPKRPRQEMKAQNEVLRARIAELEARLSLAEKVCETAEEVVAWADANPGAQPTNFAIMQAETLRADLAAWRAQK